MREALTRVLGALIESLPAEALDARQVADALWLAAAHTFEGDPTAPRPPEEGPGEADHRSDPPDAGALPEEAAGPTPIGSPPWTSARHSSYGVYDDVGGAARTAEDSAVAVAGGRALPHTLELARSLRPFMRRYPRGRQTGLDMDATLDSYSRGGELVPVIGPLPEPWFDVVLVVDSYPSMGLWEDAIEEFTTLLESIGAFRQVYRWRLITDPYPYVTDTRKRLVRTPNIPAAGGRRVVLVLSDCTAPAWYGHGVWQMLRAWAGRSPISLVNPMPTRLWHRTALDLPAVRVRSRRPGEANTALSVTVPAHLRAFTTPHQDVAIPTLTLTAPSVQRWAQGFIRGAPEGYEAVLVAPAGAPESPFQLPAAAAPGRGPAPGTVERDAARRFLRTASVDAIRLAGLCSPFKRLSLPLIQLIRQEVVPTASTADVAELLTSGFLTIATSNPGPPVITFHEAARPALAKTVGRHDAWLTHDALNRYVAERARIPSHLLGALSTLPEGLLPEKVRPFAYASRELLEALRRGSTASATPVANPYADAGGSVVAEAPDAVLPVFPEPSRSAAVLIAAPGPLPGPAEHEVHALVRELHELLTSPDGWNLTEDRCTVLLSPEPAHLRSALRLAASQSEEALLVYFVGTADGLPGSPNDAWVLGRDRTSVPLVPLFDGIAADHVLIVEDRRPAPGVSTLAVLGQWELPVLTAGRDVARFVANDRSPPADTRRSFTGSLLLGVGQGVPSAPPALALTHLLAAAERAAPERSRTHHLATRGSMAANGIALFRNHAMAAPTSRAVSPVETRARRMLAQVREALVREGYPGSRRVGSASAKAADHVLAVLVSFLSARMAAPAAGRRWSDHVSDGTFRSDLQAFLAPYGVVAEEGRDPAFALRLRAPHHDEDTVVLAEVFNFGDPARWMKRPPGPEAAPLPEDQSVPLVLLIILDGYDEPAEHLSGSVKAVHATRRSSGEPDTLPTAMVTFHFPSEERRPPPMPARRDEPSVDILRREVATSCRNLRGQRAGSLSAPSPDHALLFAPDALPTGLTEITVDSVVPDLTSLRYRHEHDGAAGGGGGVLSVRATAGVMGLISAADAARLPDATPISEQPETVYLSIQVPVVLDFAWRMTTAPRARVSLLRAQRADR